MKLIQLPLLFSTCFGVRLDEDTLVVHTAGNMSSDVATAHPALIEEQHEYGRLRTGLTCACKKAAQDACEPSLEDPHFYHPDSRTCCTGMEKVGKFWYTSQSKYCESGERDVHAGSCCHILKLNKHQTDPPQGLRLNRVQEKLDQFGAKLYVVPLQKNARFVRDGKKLPYIRDGATMGPYWVWGQNSNGQPIHQLVKSTKEEAINWLSGFMPTQRWTHSVVVCKHTQRTPDLFISKKTPIEDNCCRLLSKHEEQFQGYSVCTR
mmetsp:Transcript_4384/g.8782  ORF Transcript_4384/g.8782 Transcript_4384/m.8782 type:complete len:263 (+) Transcript_4384:59-847(+)